jgi:hypothetical protein
MFELGARVILGAVMAVVVAVGLGFALNGYAPNAPLPAPASTTTATVTFTPSYSASSVSCSPGASYRGATWEMVYNLTDGSIVSLYSPCGGWTGPPGTAAFDVTTDPALPAILANGWVDAFYVNLTTRQILPIPGVTFSQNYTEASYDGRPIINGTRLPTPYTAPGTVVQNTPTCTWPNGDRHVLWTPMNSSLSATGSIYLRVVTDQGRATVTSGMVYATHRISTSDWLGSVDYCESLSSDTNATFGTWR